MKTQTLPLSGITLGEDKRRVLVKTRKGKTYKATLSETRITQVGETAFCGIEISSSQTLWDFATIIRFLGGEGAKP
jgi:hypothetical protein